MRACWREGDAGSRESAIAPGGPSAFWLTGWLRRAFPALPLELVEPDLMARVAP